MIRNGNVLLQLAQGASALMPVSDSLILAAPAHTKADNGFAVVGWCAPKARTGNMLIDCK